MPRFQPPKGDKIGITGDDLREALSQALMACSHIPMSDERSWMMMMMMMVIFSPLPVDDMIQDP